MPCLNTDILFEIGKKLIEEGNQEDVYEFALSGIEPLHAMKRIFSSVTNLKLYTTNYEIGWGVKYSKFMLEDGKPHSKFFMHQLGSSVKNLQIYCEVPLLHQMYQPILDKIIAKKQLIDFRVDPSCTTSFLDGFLSVFSTSLKRVTIPNNLLTPTFRDTMELESLTIINPGDYKFAWFCCKTSSMTFIFTSEARYSIIAPDMILGYPHFFSPGLSSVKELTINESFKFFVFDEFEEVIKYFPSLESINYKISPNPLLWIPEIHKNYILTNVRYLMQTINRAIKVPPKVTCSFFATHYRIFRRFSYQFPYLDFERDESVKEFQCFRKTIPSGDKKPIVFEMQFFK